MPDPALTAPAVDTDSERLLSDSLSAIHARTDRLFAGLLAFQFVAGVLIALWISPRTWIGGQHAPPGLPAIGGMIGMGK